MDSLLDYIPIVGDLYRAGKMGWKVGSLLGDYWYGDNQTLTKGVEHLNNAIDSDNPSITKVEAEKAITLFNQSESDKKYQLAYIYYLRSLCYYLIAISNIVIGNNDVKKNFNNAISDLNSVCEIETTLLTTKKDTILQLQAEAKSHILEIKDVKDKWLRYYKEQHPWKYRLRWIIPIIIFICLGIFALLSYENATINDYEKDNIEEGVVIDETDEVDEADGDIELNIEDTRLDDLNSNNESDVPHEYQNNFYVNKVFSGGGNGGGLGTSLTIHFEKLGECICVSDWYQAFENPVGIVGTYYIEGKNLVVKCHIDESLGVEDPYDVVFRFDILDNGKTLSFDHSDPNAEGTIGNDFMEVTEQSDDNNEIAY